MPFGSDGDFSEHALIGRINNDLGNDLGNLLHRALTMIEKYFGGSVPPLGEPDEPTRRLQDLAAGTVKEVHEQIGKVQFSRALEAIWSLVSAANRHVETSKPWALAKDPANKDTLGTVMYSLAATLRVVSALLWPFMPAKMEDLRTQFGLQPAPGPLAVEADWAGLEPGLTVAKGDPLFPKIQE
jgi:methionyl-tRNA synthetase